MAENKTKATDGSVDDYIAAIHDEARRKDCEALAVLMERASGQKPTMWGTSIVGYGSYHYRYASGREGDSCLVGFSSRKGDISVYGLASTDEHEKLLAQLGKHTMGKGCLYIRKLGDIDQDILERMIIASIAHRQSQYG
jgi:hypothetical protein